MQKPSKAYPCVDNFETVIWLPRIFTSATWSSIHLILGRKLVQGRRGSWQPSNMTKTGLVARSPCCDLAARHLHCREVGRNRKACLRSLELSSLQQKVHSWTSKTVRTLKRSFPPEEDSLAAVSAVRRSSQTIARHSGSPLTSCTNAQTRNAKKIQV